MTSSGIVGFTPVAMSGGPFLSDRPADLPYTDDLTSRPPPYPDLSPDVSRSTRQAKPTILMRVLTRRRFAFLLGGAVAGLWLPSTGLVRLERGFVLAIAGTCSFCGKHNREVRALVGTARVPHRICDECLSLCLEIVSEGMGLDPPRDMHGHLVPSLDDEEHQDYFAEILRRLADHHESPHRDALLDDLRHALDTPLKPIDGLYCSFCGKARRDVAKLISGTRVFICDGCVGDAGAVVTHVLRIV
jgi:hypothetical protein